MLSAARMKSNWLLLQVTCMIVDQAGAMLWTGHADGRVSGFWLGAAPGSAINNRRKFHWQVRIRGAIV